MSYSIFKAPVLSFYSKDFYRATALEGKGSGMLYLLVAVLVANALSVASGYFHLVASIESAEVAAIVEKLPDINVTDGKMRTNKPNPYLMTFKNPQTKEETKIMFDTSGQTTKPPEDVKLLLTQDNVIFQDQEEPITWTKVTGGSNFDLAASSIKPALKQVALWILAFGALVFGFVAWIFHIILVMIYGLVGLVMDQRKLGYKTAMRMSCVAITPTIVLSTLFFLLFATPELWPVITIPISIGFLYFGYSAANKTANVETGSL